MRALSLASAIVLVLTALVICATMVPRGIAMYAHVQIPAAVLGGLALGRPSRRLAATWTVASLVASWASAGMLFHAACDGDLDRNAGDDLGHYVFDDDDAVLARCDGLAAAMRVLTNVLSGVLVVFLFYLALATMRDKLEAVQRRRRRPTHREQRPAAAAAAAEVVLLVPLSSLTTASRPVRAPSSRAEPRNNFSASTPHWLFGLVSVLYLRPAMHFVVVPTTFWPMMSAFAFGLYDAGGDTAASHRWAAWTATAAALAAAASAVHIGTTVCYDPAEVVSSPEDACARDAYTVAAVATLLAGSLAERAWS